MSVRKAKVAENSVGSSPAYNSYPESSASNSFRGTVETSIATEVDDAATADNANRDEMKQEIDDVIPDSSIDVATISPSAVRLLVSRADQLFNERESRIPIFKGSNIMETSASRDEEASKLAEKDSIHGERGEECPTQQLEQNHKTRQTLMETPEIPDMSNEDMSNVYITKRPSNLRNVHVITSERENGEHESPRDDILSTDCVYESDSRTHNGRVNDTAIPTRIRTATTGAVTTEALQEDHREIARELETNIQELQLDCKIASVGERTAIENNPRVSTKESQINRTNDEIQQSELNKHSSSINSSEQANTSFSPSYLPSPKPVGKTESQLCMRKDLKSEPPLPMGSRRWLGSANVHVQVCHQTWRVRRGIRTTGD